MAIADWIDEALTGLPGYKQAALWPGQQQQQRLQNQRGGLENQSIESYLSEIGRQREEQAAAPGATHRVLQAWQPQPGRIDRSGAMDTGENPEAAGTPAPTTPGRGAARTAPELFGRGVSPEDYRLAEQYNKPTMASLGLMTPEALSQKNVEEQVKRGQIAKEQRAESEAQRTSGLREQLDALDPSAPDYATQVRALITRMSGAAHPEAVLKDLNRQGAAGASAQPETMDIGGEKWTKVPNLETGVPAWHRAPAKPEKESAIEDWIASHPKEIAGLSPEQARDKARASIEARTVTTRVNITQPQLGQDAVDRAADYVNTTGQLPAGLGFGNQRIRMQILDRAAQRAREMGGEMGMAAAQANFKANSAELSRLQTQRGPVMAFMQTAEHHLARADQLSQAVDRTEIPVLNRWLLSGETNWAGNPKTAVLAGVTRLATTEVAKVISSATGGGGVVSDSARKEVEDVLRPAMTKGQFSDVTAALRGLMQDRAGGYDQMIAATQSRMKTLGPGGAAPAGASPTAGPVKWGRDANGNPVRMP